MLGDLQRKRQTELDQVNNILGKDPLELAPLYIEPNYQTVNPANLDEDDNVATSLSHGREKSGGRLSPDSKVI